MRQYKMIQVEKIIENKEVSKIICNKCGREIEMIFPAPVVFSAKQSWSYGSNHDMECHQFDLCESCYDEFINGFQVPVEVTEYEIG